ncbi:MAG: M48 family metallopeptidase [Vicinamibacteria bacterium]
MTDLSASSIGWTCPQCGRRVPMRVVTCRCGTTRPGAVPTEAGGSPPAPPEPHAAAVAPAAASLPRTTAPRAPAIPPAGSFDESLRAPRERQLFGIAVVFSSLVWLALVVSIVGIFYGVAGLLFGLLAQALFLASVRGNGLCVSERQLPDVHEAVVRSSRRLGLAEVPEVYVVQAGGTLNAFATRLLTRKFVIIFSDLIDACQDARQLEFVVGHEVGHLAAGHLKWNTFLWPFMLVPLLGMAYSRAREYTCDLCGLAVVEDPEPAMRGLIVLAAGGRQAARADVGAFMEQRLETGTLWSAVVELASTHPYLCKRVAALHEHLHPGSLDPVGRNPLAYPLAPVLGFGAAAGGMGSMLVVVAIIGIIAAIAIPSLLRARISANESAALASVRSVMSAEADFAQVAGAFGSIACMAGPASCLRGYQGPALLDAGFASDVRQGYRHSLELADDGRSFAYQALPLTPGQTGTRAFCGDASGVICAAPADQAGAVGLTRGPACDPDRCQPLR